MAEQSLNFARKGIKPVSKLIILSIISIALMMLDNRYAAVQAAKGYAATALYPLQWLANQPVRLYEYMSGFMQSQTALLASNRQLLEENGRLKMLAQQTQQQKRELQDFARAQNTDLHVLSPIDTALEQKCCVDESIFLSNVAMVQQAACVIADVDRKSVV